VTPGTLKMVGFSWRDCRFGEGKRVFQVTALRRFTAQWVHAAFFIERELPTATSCRSGLIEY
jgi:hypothetical protein